MDGLAEKFLAAPGSAPSGSGLSMSRRQRTLAHAIGCMGVGLHSGHEVSLTLHPAAAGSGIVFRRSDLGASEARVGTVEHVMAALSAAGVTNAVVEVNGPEIPVLDGSAAPFLFLLDCAGLVDQLETASVIEVLRPVRVEEGAGFAELLPSNDPGLRMEVSIDFTASVIGRQSLWLDLTNETFRHELAGSRTFAMAAEIDALRKAGLARGGSLDNAVVVDGDRVLNPAGLQTPDEFVRHKMLDAVGDLYLAGAAIHGKYRAHRPGHGLNNRLLRALFADRANYVIGFGGLSQAA